MAFVQAVIFVALISTVISDDLMLSLQRRMRRQSSDIQRNPDSISECPFNTTCVCEDYDGGYDLW